jgi:hypothetical protein
MSAIADPVALETHVARLRARIGTTGPVITRRMERGPLVKFARATGHEDLPPDAAEEPAIAPPTYVSTFADEAMAGFFDLAIPGLDMFLHTEDAVTLGVPIRAGDEIRASATYADVYLRAGRAGPLLFQVADLLLVNQHGAPAATLRVSMASFASPVA